MNLRVLTCCLSWSGGIVVRTAQCWEVRFLLASNDPGVRRSCLGTCTPSTWVGRAVLDWLARLDLHLRPLSCLPSRRLRRAVDLLTLQQAAAGPRAEAAASR